MSNPALIDHLGKLSFKYFGKLVSKVAVIEEGDENALKNLTRDGAIAVLYAAIAREYVSLKDATAQQAFHDIILEMVKFPEEDKLAQ